MNLKQKSEDFLKNLSDNTNNTIKRLELNSYTFNSGIYYINNIGFDSYNKMLMFVIAHNNNLEVQK